MVRSTARIPNMGVDASEGGRIPFLELNDAAGQPVRLWNYRGRRNLVLLFAGAALEQGMSQLLQQLAQRRAELDEEEAVVLVIWAARADMVREKQRELDLPFRILVDADGAGHRRFGATGPDGSLSAAFITDRYSVVVAQTRPGEPLPTGSDVQAWLQYINIQCPE